MHFVLFWLLISLLIVADALFHTGGDTRLQLMSFCSVLEYLYTGRCNYNPRVGLSASREAAKFSACHLSDIEMLEVIRIADKYWTSIVHWGTVIWPKSKASQVKHLKPYRNQNLQFY